MQQSQTMKANANCRRANKSAFGNKTQQRSGKKMAKKNSKSLDQFKMEAASEVGVNLKSGYNGDLTAREAGSIGGQMVKKMVESYEGKSK